MLTLFSLVYLEYKFHKRSQCWSSYFVDCDDHFFHKSILFSSILYKIAPIRNQSSYVSTRIGFNNDKRASKYSGLFLITIGVSVTACIFIKGSVSFFLFSSFSIIESINVSLS